MQLGGNEDESSEKLLKTTVCKLQPEDEEFDSYFDEDLHFDGRDDRKPIRHKPLHTTFKERLSNIKSKRVSSNKDDIESQKSISDLMDFL